ncbi:hypothetical protein NDN16_12615 [Aureimonas altamirensis]|uniref:hypothetical protein n=1 Tax=Aureimonas altamirensis TaxID=370622 RepID=UPI00203761E7|nr:hypothetical protein [Aureimonas altamirensis]MCM2504514.1 hypothetical protein [Aureimonas altamirensis]
MGVADKAKAAKGTGDPPGAPSMATLTRTLEELERRLARLSTQKQADGRASASAGPGATPAERLRRIVDRSAEYAAAAPAARTRSSEAIDELVQEMRSLRGEMRKEIAAGTKAGQATMGHAFATLEASLAARDSSDLIADGLAAMLTRMSTLEERGATNEALSELNADLDRMRAIVSGLATQEDLTRHMGSVTGRLDALLESSAAAVDRGAFDAGVAALGERLSGIESLLARLPETLGIERIEDRLKALAPASGSVAWDTLSVSVDLSALEERLDEISGAILVLDRPEPGADRIEKRLEALSAQLDGFMERLEQAEAERSLRHAEAFTQELKRLEALWQGSDERAAETEAQLLSILRNVADRLADLETEARQPGEDIGGTVFDAEFATWQPAEDGQEDSLRATLDRHLKRRRADGGPQAEASGGAAPAEPEGSTRYGRDVADFGSILERVRRHERAAGLGPSTRADFIAAARRAAAAAAAEAESLHAANGSGNGAGEGASGRDRSYRKPMVMAAGAIMLALTALPISRLQTGPSEPPAEIADNGAMRGPGVTQETTASIPRPPEAGLTSGDLIGRLVSRLPQGAAGALPVPPAGNATLSRAAIGGDAAAMAAIGAAAIDRGATAEGLSWLGQAARRGYAPAQYRLGSLHERGVGVAKDLSLARGWYLVAARAGNVRAMHNLAVIDISGLAGPADRGAAADWFRMAAERGMADSQFNLAVLYARGAGMPRDAAEAYRWFSIAARGGDATALRNRDEVGAELDAARRAAIDAEVARWRPATPTRAANEERYSGSRV